jgi:hypothetical protein
MAKNARRRAGSGFTKIAEWRWLKPVFAGQFELAERPAEFTRLRDDKNPKQVMRELQGGATWRLAI